MPDGVGPEASTQSKGPKTPEAGSSGCGSKREKRRHSVHMISVNRGKNTPLHNDTVSAGISGDYCYNIIILENSLLVNIDRVR